MKKILYIILCFLAFVPSIVFASEKELNIYLFYGDGCPHCAAEEKFLNEYLKKEKNVKIKKSYEERNGAYIYTLKTSLLTEKI